MIRTKTAAALTLALLAACGPSERISDPPDASESVDAGLTVDAGDEADAGASEDAGLPVDAGDETDAGPPDCAAASDDAECKALGCRFFTCQGEDTCTAPSVDACDACPSLAGCDTPNTEACAEHHGDVDGCQGAAGCAFYQCGFGGSGACFSRNAPGCEVCPDVYECPGCEQFDGDADACHASPLGCRVRDCAPDKCLSITATACEACPSLAGCEVENTAACAAQHADFDGCDGAGCAYYFCGFGGEGACFPSDSDGCSICPADFCE